VLPPGWTVRTQLPLSLDEESSPEPDVAVVPGRPGDYRQAHPVRPALAIEVADSSLAFDRAQKGSLYARGGIQDYWIVNLVDRVVEVYREPTLDPAAAFDWRYRSATVLGPAGVVVPLAFPTSRIVVADLLP
jgi:Uma2 family endonuclease